MAIRGHLTRQHRKNVKRIKRRRQKFADNHGPVSVSFKKKFLINDSSGNAESSLRGLFSIETHPTLIEAINYI
jgi:hypothetical protein